jgi:N-formylglutamate amidohydrolase
MNRPLALLLAFFVGVGAACSSAGPGSSLEPAGGDAQTGLTGVPLADSLVVRLTDGDGAPLPDRAVTWHTTGDDSVAPTTVITDGNGVARAWVRLGPDPGTDTVVARAEGFEVAFPVPAEHATVGTAYQGRAGYVSYVAGSLPIIVSAAHGGAMEPDEIPDRSGGTQVRDADTDRLALAIADSLEPRLGGRPHLIVSRLHRRKLDPNREIGEAAEGHPLAEQAWHEFHAFIEHASDRVADHGPGLLVDVHGHGHEIDRLELGYLLDAADLARPDSDLLDPTWAEFSSIRSLAGRADASFPALLRGTESLGTLFEERGVPAVPSQAQPDPGNAPFFSGGYNTRRHGSRESGVIDAVQIEAHRPGVRDTEANRAAFGGVAAAVLQAFLEAHYGIRFRDAR